MRQLKFRQPIYHRDGSFREWHYWGLFESDGEWVNIAPASRNYMVDVKITDPFDSTQFAGLTDKNGVEIYEGDIVMLNHWKSSDLFDYSKPFVVTWEYGQINFKQGSYNNFIGSLSGKIDIEVTGNIYEHKTSQHENHTTY